MSNLRISNIVGDITESDKERSELLGVHTSNKPKQGNKLTVSTLQSSYTPINTTFSPETIIRQNNERRQLLLNNYMIQYDKCITHIKQENNTNKTDTIYEVASHIPGLPNYDSSECILYIDNKLRGIYFDTYIMDTRTLFISWKYLELNKYEAKHKR